MNKFLASIQYEAFRILRNDEGASAIEYALVAGLIAVAIVVGAQTLGTDIGALFGRISGAVTGAGV